MVAENHIWSAKTKNQTNKKKSNKNNKFRGKQKGYEIRDLVSNPGSAM